MLTHRSLSLQRNRYSYECLKTFECTLAYNGYQIVCNTPARLKTPIRFNRERPDYKSTSLHVSSQAIGIISFSILIDAITKVTLALETIAQAIHKT